MTGRESLIAALRHDAEIGAGVRHNDARTLTSVRYSEAVLKLLEAVEASHTEVVQRRSMERVPTGDPLRYSTHRSLWELAKKRRDAAFAYLEIAPESVDYAEKENLDGVR